MERLTAALRIAGSQTGVAAGPGAGDHGGAGDHIPERGLRLQVLGSLRVWRDGVVVSLGGVRVEDLSVRASIASGYESLSAAAQRAFRLLALLGPCDVAESVIGALLDDPDPGRVVEDLTDRSMLSVAGTDGTGQTRYRLHDLLLDYAADQLIFEPADKRAVVLRRVQDGWLQLAALASDGLPAEPFFSTPPQRSGAGRHTGPPCIGAHGGSAGVVWCGAAEPAGGDGACLRAGRLSSWSPSGRLPDHFQNLQDRHDDSVGMWQVVAKAAGQAGDGAMATVAKVRLAAATLEAGYSADARVLLSDSVETLEEFGDDENLAFALYWRAASARDLDYYDATRRDTERGVALARRIHDSHAELANLRILGPALVRTGDTEEGLAACELALQMAIDSDEPLFRLYALHNLAFCCTLAGRYERAAELARLRRELSWELGYISAEALSLAVLADAYSGLGRYGEAIAAYSEALPVFRDLFIRRNYALCLYKMGRACLATGDLGRRALSRRCESACRPRRDDAASGSACVLVLGRAIRVAFWLAGNNRLTRVGELVLSSGDSPRLTRGRR